METNENFTMVSNDILRSEIDPYSFKIYCFLKSYHPCFPGYDHIAEKTGIARSTVIRRIKELVADGFLDVARGYKGKSNTYFVKEPSRLDPNKFDYYSDEFRKLRHRVFLRDGEVCTMCGKRPKPGVILTIDHVLPISRYPSRAMDIENLQVLCLECNQKKSNKDYIKKPKKLPAKSSFAVFKADLDASAST